MKPLSLDQATKLDNGTILWMEEIGGFEGTRYIPQKIKITEKDSNVMYFENIDCSSSSGRAWYGYNRKFCGWRLWEEKPTHDEFMTARWDDGINGELI